MSDSDNPRLDEAWEELMYGTAPVVFITGAAGSGKSTLLRNFMQEVGKRAALVAPTGVAAINVRGQTIHSFFRFPPRMLVKSDIKMAPGYAQLLYKGLEMIVIDEASMVRSDVMDAIDWFMKKNGRSTFKPFGGCRLIMFGDLHQLPPIENDDDTRYDGPFFFNSKVLEKLKIKTIQLDKIYRQTDSSLIDVLNAIRVGSATEEDLELLNRRVDPDFDPDPADTFITLVPTNAMADKINVGKLAALPGVSQTYKATINGDVSQREWPVPLNLELKVGAQIVFVRNDKEKRWVNSTLGRVARMYPTSVEVEIQENGQTRYVHVQYEAFEVVKHVYNAREKCVDTETLGAMNQLPIKLAWGQTIHKAQAATYDRVLIDFGKGAFAAGQAYVALSRCRTLEGMVLRRPVRMSDVIVDERVVSFLNDEPPAPKDMLF